MGKTRDLFKKIRDIKQTFHTRMGMIKSEMVRTYQKQKRFKKRQQENTEELYRKVLMTWITTIVFSFTQSQTFWSMKSSGLYEALVRTKLVEVMEFLLSYVKILKDDAALRMSASLENSSVATGLEKTSFHFNPKEGQ